MIAMPRDRNPEPGPEASPDAVWAVRRHTDRCFFEAEEVVHGPGGAVEGYIVEGILWSVDDVAEARPSDGAACEQGGKPGGEAGCRSSVTPASRRDSGRVQQGQAGLGN